MRPDISSLPSSTTSPGAATHPRGLVVARQPDIGIDGLGADPHRAEVFGIHAKSDQG